MQNIIDYRKHYHDKKKKINKKKTEKEGEKGNLIFLRKQVITRQKSKIHESTNPPFSSSQGKIVNNNYF